MRDDLAAIQIAGLPMVTSLGTVGVTALDERSIRVLAGRDSPFPPLTVNRLAVDIDGYYAPNPYKGGEWNVNHHNRYRLDVYRAGTWGSATWNAYGKVKEALLPAVREWVASHPEVLAAAQFHEYGEQIAEKHTELKRLFDEIVSTEQQAAELIHERDLYRLRWSAGTIS